MPVARPICRCDEGLLRLDTHHLDLQEGFVAVVKQIFGLSAIDANNTEK
jgi:hypothetical protein